MHTITCFAAIRAAGAWAVAFLAWQGGGSAWTPSCAMLQSAFVTWGGCELVHWRPRAARGLRGQLWTPSHAKLKLAQATRTECRVGNWRSRAAWRKEEDRRGHHHVQRCNHCLCVGINFGTREPHGAGGGLAWTPSHAMLQSMLRRRDKSPHSRAT